MAEFFHELSVKYSCEHSNRESSAKSNDTEGREIYSSLMRRVLGMLPTLTTKLTDQTEKRQTAARTLNITNDE